MEERKLGGNYNPPQTPIEEQLKKATTRKDVHLHDLVIWHDSVGNPHNALVTAVWSQNCINVVFVSDDSNKQDTYGRQIERATSCNYKTSMNVHGFYWRFVEDEPNGYTAPLER